MWANRQAESDESVGVRAQEIFARMEAGHPGELAAWQDFRDISIQVVEWF